MHRKVLLFIGVLFLAPALASAGTAVLVWDHDGQVDGFTIHYGCTSSGNYTAIYDAGKNLKATIGNLPIDKNCYFRCKAYLGGLESEFSNEASGRASIIPATFGVDADWWPAMMNYYLQR